MSATVLNVTGKNNNPVTSPTIILRSWVTICLLLIKFCILIFCKKLTKKCLTLFLISGLTKLLNLKQRKNK